MHVDLPSIVDSAWVDTISYLDNLDSTRTERSRIWVDRLANAFKDVYVSDSTNPRFRVFWGSMVEEDPDFARKEYLHDILVCKTDTVRSIGNRQQNIPFVSEVHWQVESELALNTRQISIDFSKLVMGSAEKKLFVTVRSKREDITENLIDACCEMGSFVFGELYLCLLDDIDKWTEDCDYPEVINLLNY